MKKIIHIVILFNLLFSAFFAKAQNTVGYWDDVDFSAECMVKQ